MSELEQQLRALVLSWREKSAESDKSDYVGLTRHYNYNDCADALSEILDNQSK